MSLAALALGTGEILLVAAVVLLLFGARRLPGLARAIGESGRELRKGFADEEDADSAPNG